MTGMVFDIREFTVHDGPGLRTTVFLKGCPLRCKWCHNPESWSREPQKNLKTGRMIGEEWTAEELCRYLVRFRDAFQFSGGGVTFSGGEATAQPEFLIACSDILRIEGIKVNLDTCGYCDSALFREILRHIDLCYYDLKCMNSALHRQMTGVDNGVILANARLLAESGVKYHIRVPLVDGVGKTTANRAETEAFVNSLPRAPERLDYLPFNDLAPAKYPIYGMKYGFTDAKGGRDDRADT